jgi:hypothetical protein
LFEPLVEPPFEEDPEEEAADPPPCAMALSSFWQAVSERPAARARAAMVSF